VEKKTLAANRKSYEAHKHNERETRDICWN